MAEENETPEITISVLRQLLDEKEAQIERLIVGETQIEREGAAQIEAAELSANDQNLPSNSLEIAPETREDPDIETPEETIARLRRLLAEKTAQHESLKINSQRTGLQTTDGNNLGEEETKNLTDLNDVPVKENESTN